MEYTTTTAAGFPQSLDKLLNAPAEIESDFDGNNSLYFPTVTAAGIQSKSPTLQIFQFRVVPSFFLVLCVVGLFGNGVVISALWSIMARNLIKSVTDILVINLAIADFIFVGSLPFWATELFMKRSWIFGTVGCKLLSFITLLNLYGSVFFLVAMGIDRCLAVVYAVRARNYRTPRKAVIASVVIWILASLVGMQALMWRTIRLAGTRSVCVWKVPSSFTNAYFVIRMALGFFIPFVVIVFCYILIILKLHRRLSTRLTGSSMTNQQQKITRAILAVISLFVVCWLPNHIVTLISALTTGDKSARAKMDLATANLVSACLAYANSAINPILYAFMKEEIRQEGTEMILKLCTCCRRTNQSNTRGSSGGRRTFGHMFSFWRSNNNTTLVTSALPQKRDICPAQELSKLKEKLESTAEHEDSVSNSLASPSITQVNGHEDGQNFSLPEDGPRMNLIVKIDGENCG